MNTRYKNSSRLLEKASRIIPTGTQTFSKSHLQFPVGCAPHFIRQGYGGRVRDIDGNEYVDLVAGLLAIMLGYMDSDVDSAITKQLQHGINFSLASELEYELATRLVETIPCAEMVRFSKNGTDVTSAAIRIARAATGRDHVITCGYHGWQDWYIGSTVRNKGVPEDITRLTHTVKYNDFEQLESTFSKHSDKIAALIMEPVHSASPEVDYLENVKELVHSHGAILIFDEIITGFRFANGGAQELYDVYPDLACFGKALGNGMPITAIVGKEELMREYEEIFLSGTFGGEALSLAAAIAVVDKINNNPVIEALWEKGKFLGDKVKSLISHYSLEDNVRLMGLDPMQSIVFSAHQNATSEEMKTLFVSSMLENGVLTTGNHNIIYAHTTDDFETVINAYQNTFEKLVKELKHPGLSDRLGCELIRPIFSIR